MAAAQFPAKTPAQDFPPKRPRGPPLLIRLISLRTSTRGEEGGGVAVSSPDWRMHQRGGQKRAGRGGVEVGEGQRTRVERSSGVERRELEGEGVEWRRELRGV